MLSKHLLAMLATWRITEMLHDEDMPFEIGTKLRRYVAESSHKSKMNYNGNLPYLDSTITNKWLYEVHKALQCRWCLSTQVGIAIAILLGVNPLWGFAYSAGSLFFGKLFAAIPVS